MRFRAKTYLAGLTAALLSAGLIINHFTFAEGGSGGVGGPGVGTPGLGNFTLMVHDEAPGAPNFQGYDAYSTTWFITHSGQWTNYDLNNMDSNSKSQIYQACRQALDEADNRLQAAVPDAPRGQSRVVAIGVNYQANYTWSVNPVHFRQAFDTVYGGWYPNRIGYWNSFLPSLNLYLKTGYLFYDGINKAGSTPRVVCVALNNQEPPIAPPKPPPSPADYELEVNTRAHSISTHEGNTSTVNDTLNLSMREVCDEEECAPPEPDNISGTVWLNWESDGSHLSASKPFGPVSTDSTSTTIGGFRPSDFGWEDWKPGYYWYDVTIPQQGSMTSSVNTPDREPLDSHLLPMFLLMR